MTDMTTTGDDTAGEIDPGHINDLAELMAPRLVAEYGPGVSREDVAREIEDTDKHPELAGLSDGDLELLYDEIRDLAPTLTITVS